MHIFTVLSFLYCCPYILFIQKGALWAQRQSFGLPLNLIHPLSPLYTDTNL